MSGVADWQDAMKRWIYSGAILLLLLAAGVLGGLKARRVLAWANAVRPPVWSAPGLTFRAARPAFPFSIVPGGVHEWKELLDSANRDPVVRRHFSDVRMEGLYPTRTTAPMLVYVSYRVGDDVRWTKNKIRIPAGELVLTDGYNVVRGRCGNRVRQLPPPLAGTTPPPEEEPPEIVFEIPGPLISEPPFVAPVLVEQAVSKPPVIVSPPPPIWPPIGPPITPPLPPVAVTPEPGTLMLFVSGMGVLGGLKWRLRKRTQR